jgi:hypothetical protein
MRKNNQQKQTSLELAQYSLTLAEAKREQAEKALADFRESEKGSRYYFFVSEEDNRREPDRYTEPTAPASECPRTLKELSEELRLLEEACF